MTCRFLQLSSKQTIGWKRHFAIAWWTPSLIYCTAIQCQVCLIKEFILDYEGEADRNRVDIRTGEDLSPFLPFSSPEPLTSLSRSECLHGSRQLRLNNQE